MASLSCCWSHDIHIAIFSMLVPAKIVWVRLPRLSGSLPATEQIHLKELSHWIVFWVESSRGWSLSGEWPGEWGPGPRAKRNWELSAGGLSGGWAGSEVPTEGNRELLFLYMFHSGNGDNGFTRRFLWTFMCTWINHGRKWNFELNSERNCTIFMAEPRGKLRQMPLSYGGLMQQVTPGQVALLHMVENRGTSLSPWPEGCYTIWVCSRRGCNVTHGHVSYLISIWGHWFLKWNIKET